MDGTLGQREAVLGTEREDDRVVVGGRLQLEVERDAEPFAQRQAEGAVHAAAEGRVHDQLRPLALVEAALHHDALAGGEEAQCGQPGGAVGHHLLRHLGRDTGPLDHQSARRLAVLLAQERFEAPRRSLTAMDSSAERAGASPNQKGMVGGRSPAS